MKLPTGRAQGFRPLTISEIENFGRRVAEWVRDNGAIVITRAKMDFFKGNLAIAGNQYLFSLNEEAGVTESITLAEMFKYAMKDQGLELELIFAYIANNPEKQVPGCINELLKNDSAATAECGKFVCWEWFADRNHSHFERVLKEG